MNTPVSFKAAKWPEFEIGDTVFLNSVKDGKKQLIIVDRLEPRLIEGTRCKQFTTWDHDIYITACQLSASSKIRKAIATPLEWGERTETLRYVIVDESLDNKILPHRILEQYDLAPYFKFQGGDRYRAAKVGSIYQWGVEEVLTHSHKEVRDIAKDWLNGIVWAKNVPKMP